jgi:arylsulfatase A-like enzyme
MMRASASPSAFGGPIAAPSMTRVCDEGVRYNRFHVTALCSPTRAALLTGRNHHAVGFGSIGEFSSGFPGYTAFVPEDSAPFPKVLQGNGYKGWFTVIRFYNPLPSFFDKTWRSSEIEPA